MLISFFKNKKKRNTLKVMVWCWKNPSHLKNESKSEKYAVFIPNEDISLCKEIKVWSKTIREQILRDFFFHILGDRDTSHYLSAFQKKLKRKGNNSKLFWIDAWQYIQEHINKFVWICNNIPVLSHKSIRYIQ